MKGFITVTETSCQSVFVNVNHIICVEPDFGEDKNTTIIHLANHMTIYANESFEAVKSSIRLA